MSHTPHTHTKKKPLRSFLILNLRNVPHLGSLERQLNLSKDRTHCYRDRQAAQQALNILYDKLTRGNKLLRSPGPCFIPLFLTHDSAWLRRRKLSHTTTTELRYVRYAELMSTFDHLSFKAFSVLYNCLIVFFGAQSNIDTFSKRGGEIFYSFMTQTSCTH